MTDSLSTSGASPKAIQAHYDTDNQFFGLWLDESMTYSSALYLAETDSFEQAQLNKIDHHIRESGAVPGSRVLDIGCGWGANLRRLHEQGITNTVGLTLSKAQLAYCKEHGPRSADVRLESWEEHEPDELYDSLISVGAIEHFVRPEDDAGTRVMKYEHFFKKCAAMLKPNGQLSLQTSVYAKGGYVTGAVALIFPESDLPRLSQLATAAESVLELVCLRNDRADYERTCREWRRRLRAKQTEATTLTDASTYARYEGFLGAAQYGFKTGVFDLLRLTYRNSPID
ncbi:MAG: cyclopropane-fatty-acyl-phospholipid synthase [Bradymonadia bacterium]|jgi:cyclopropane-fatty-acyl-phospholipid synthase